VKVFSASSFSLAVALSALLLSLPAASGQSSAKLELKHDKAVVGAAVHVTGTGLPSGKTVELVWGTVKGGWVIEDYFHFRGRKYADSTTSLGHFQVDGNGRLAAEFKIPEDFGGVHEVIAMVDGKAVAQNGIEVTQSFEMSPLSGPIGTPIELRVKGLGWRTMENTWIVNWDNREVGLVTAASNRGSAVARFRAAGPAGDHPVKLYTGYLGESYLNHEQAPTAHLPRPEYMFHVTNAPSPAATAYAEPYQQQPVPKTDVEIANAAVKLSSTQGPVGSKTTLLAEGFPKGASLKLVWQTYVGSRVSGNGFEPVDKVIGDAKIGNDGRLELAVTIPEDLGGLHSLLLRDHDKTLARAYFVIETSIVSISPTSGPPGTPVTIHLKGVGWTEYDNILTATYDNAYMGYACGFNTQGDVVINFMAAGSPGTHLIDLFPGIYQGPATEQQQLYRLPQLTYAEDHPGNKIPALHFKFEVTPSVEHAAHAEN